MNASETAPKRPRILFVRPQYGTEDGPREFFDYDRLQEQFELIVYPRLCDEVIEIVRESLSTEPYDLVITHVPWDSDSTYRSVFTLPGEEYLKSLAIINKIKLLADIPIIAYTSASQQNMAYFPCSGIDAVVRRTGDVDGEAKLILASAGKLLQTYQKGPPPAPEPGILRQNGHTSTEVTVTLLNGLDTMAAAGIAKRCEPYPREVICRNMSNDNTGDLRNIMSSLMLEVTKDTRLSIDIDEDTDEAEKLVRELYSALSSKYSALLNFDRFAR